MPAPLGRPSWASDRYGRFGVLILLEHRSDRRPTVLKKKKKLGRVNESS